MTLSAELLEILACPKCHGELNYRESDHRLDCQPCKLSFRLENGVPIMLIDEAEPLPKD